MANPNLKIPSYDEWVSGGTYQTGKKLDPNDKNMKGYYDNYKATVTDLINSGNLAHAKATVESHGHKWTDKKKKKKKKDDKKAPVKSTATYDKPDPYKAPTYTAPTKTETPAAEERPTYQGPAHDPDEDITPVGITLKPVEDDEFVENRIANMLDKNSPLFRNAAEARLRAMASSGLGRNSSMANEEVMRALFAVVGPIAEADARMLERHRTLNNTAYFQQMNTRLQGVIQKTLAHIAGGYDIQAATMKDITDRWRAQLDADIKQYGIDVSSATQRYTTDVGAATKVYGIDVSAATQKYGIDVGWEKTKYVTDMQRMLGMQGIKISAAQILASIEDNAQATAYIWNLIFGDNVSPGDWLDKWKKKWETEQGDNNQDGG
jgi:hypothetical protein